MPIDDAGPNCRRVMQLANGIGKSNGMGVGEELYVLKSRFRSHHEPNHRD